MKRTLLIWLGVFFMVVCMAIAASAQSSSQSFASIPHMVDACRVNCTPTSPPPADSDGDGIADSRDSCPNAPGPVSNGGCPLSNPTPIPSTPVPNPSQGNNPPPQPSDQNGAGIPNASDPCANGNCPVNPTAPAVALPVISPNGDCMLATRGAEAVNVRAAPSLTAKIVGHLSSRNLYPVLAHLVNAEGTWAKIADGWSARWVVREGGNCDTLTHIQIGALLFDSNPGPPDSPLAIINPNPDVPETFLATFRNHSKPVRLSRLIPGNPSSSGDCANGDSGAFQFGGGGFEPTASAPCDPSSSGDCTNGDSGAFQFGGGGFEPTASAPCDPSSSGDCANGDSGAFQFGGGGFEPTASAPCDPSSSGDCANGDFGRVSVWRRRLRANIVRPL